jgi:glycosyltransferase involved in cell wall biosynthesis
MKVSMISSPYDGCNYVRIMLPAWHNGFWLDKPSIEATRPNPGEIRKMLIASDIVVFHRPEKNEHHALADMLIADGKKIVVDNDDTFKLDDVHPLAGWSPDGKYAKELSLRDKSMDDFLRKADLVTTSTEFLADEYRKINKNTIVLPNCVDQMDWDEPLRNEGDKVRIGMVGSVSYEYDYLHIKPLLRELGKRDDVELVLFGLGDAKHRKENPKVTEAFKEEYSFWDGVIKDQVPWCPVTEYPTKLNEARLDMMLIPRKDNYFNRCKSNVKVLEAAMCEIPCICQSFDNGPYEEFKHMSNAVLIKDNNDWGFYINNLIRDVGLRRKIGKNAKKYTLKNNNIEDKAHLWAEAYTKLCEK